MATEKPVMGEAPIAGERSLEDGDDRIDANLALAERFVAAFLADLSLLDAIPDGATVVFLPDDDPELAELNRSGGEAMREAGHLVHFQPV